MSYQVAVLGSGDVDPSLAGAWDALPPGRGVQADFYDSHAWLASWLHATGPEVAARVRIPAVLDDGRPVALLALEARSRHRWESAAARAVGTHRKRWRPVLGAEQPDHQVLELLVEQVAAAGVRELALNRLPARDPATDALLAALRRGGFAVHTRERSSDCLAVVDGGWAEHRRRFASYDRGVKRLVKRSEPWWQLCLEEYGPHAGTPALDGFAVYADLFRRSWKGSLGDTVRRERLELLRRTERLGWCRVYVLRVAGVPAAAELWFRLGEVACGPSTVYDHRMAALGPGSIVVWWAQERIFAEASPPRLIDLLPGSNPLKERLTPDRPPLLIVDAARRTLVSGASFPVQRRVRATGQAAASRARTWVRRARSRRPSRARGGVRAVEVPPTAAPTPVGVRRLEPDVALLRFLAVAGGHRSPEAMARTWPDGDGWWRVGEHALLRVGAAAAGPAPVREVVLLRDREVEVEDLLGALAAALGAPVRATMPVPVHRAVLPWPGEGRAGGAAAARSARSP
jgi:Acetyltransferase (GNAT) domain